MNILCTYLYCMNKLYKNLDENNISRRKEIILTTTALQESPRSTTVNSILYTTVITIKN